MTTKHEVCIKMQWIRVVGDADNIDVITDPKCLRSNMKKIYKLCYKPMQ